MNYSIGEFAKITGISVPTLRYYDKEGLFPTMGRTDSGIRIFSDNELGAVKVIECLKSSGMQIKDIKQYMVWDTEGDSTLEVRRELFYDKRQVVEDQIKTLEKTLAMIKFKCWYYDTALTDGGEASVKSKNIEDLPSEMQNLLKIVFE